MDLNYLYQRHQVSLYWADNAACEDSRQAHQSMANMYAERILLAKAASVRVVPSLAAWA